MNYGVGYIGIVKPKGEEKLKWDYYEDFPTGCDEVYALTKSGWEMLYWWNESGGYEDYDEDDMLCALIEDGMLSHKVEDDVSFKIKEANIAGNIYDYRIVDGITVAAIGSWCYPEDETNGEPNNPSDKAFDEMVALYIDENDFYGMSDSEIAEEYLNGNFVSR